MRVAAGRTSARGGFIGLIGLARNDRTCSICWGSLRASIYPDCANYDTQPIPKFTEINHLLVGLFRESDVSSALGSSVGALTILKDYRFQYVRSIATAFKLRNYMQRPILALA